MNKALLMLQYFAMYICTKTLLTSLFFLSDLVILIIIDNEGPQ